MNAAQRFIKELTKDVGRKNTRPTPTGVNAEWNVGSLSGRWYDVIEILHEELQPENGLFRSSCTGGKGPCGFSDSRVFFDGSSYEAVAIAKNSDGSYHWQATKIEGVEETMEETFEKKAPPPCSCEMRDLLSYGHSPGCAWRRR